jgi:hypothetical protein
MRDNIDWINSYRNTAETCTTHSRLVLYQNPKLKDSRLKNDEKIVVKQTDRWMDRQTRIMNSTEHICLKTYFKKEVLRIFQKSSILIFH